MSRDEAVDLLRRAPFAPGRARQVAVPPAARRLRTLPRVDYEDAFVAEVPDARERTGEQWARAFLEDAPAAMRRLCRSGWYALGFDLGPTESQELILGWPIHRSAEDFVLLAARSRLGMSAEVLLKRDADTLLVADFLRLGNPGARALWAGFAPGHRQVVRYLLDQASDPDRLQS
jgi:hypothetical protein